MNIFLRFISAFYPDDYVSSAYSIDYDALYGLGYRGIIFDIDNTLVPHGAPADRRSKALFSRLSQTGFKTLVLSNNKEPRVKSFADAVGATGYIYKANKPARSGYLKAMKVLGTTPENTLFVGDQLFTDIWGARRTGIRSVLTRPVIKWREEPQIILKRLPEAIVLFFYNRQRDIR